MGLASTAESLLDTLDCKTKTTGGRVIRGSGLMKRDGMASSLPAFW